MRRWMSGRRRDLEKVGAKKEGKREKNIERILGMGKKERGILGNRWKEQRREIWKGWWEGLLEEEGWIEMDRMLFSEEGTERVKELGRKTKWMERR
ncbi:hypothetical protein C7212DRAFT_332719 [Tuber magnatum]|uniref:Uncharacterized protein n=1 Tax=Tuber magnatum TaxID=42249 RepID=A0A317SJP5_9PEZI|nr:hypothetical protein C7212DRAFT_332719 [Tuber magnatum]